MDLKKLTFPDQFPNFASSSPRRKVVSSFGVGLVASFLILSVVLFNISFKAPYLNPVFQGFSSLGTRNNSSLISWPFSFSSTSVVSSAGNRTSASRYDNDTSVAQDLQYSVCVNETHKENVDVSSKGSDFVGSYGKDAVLGNTTAENEAEKLQNGSLSLGRGDEVKNNETNGSQKDENADLVKSGGNEMELNKTNVGSFSDSVKNASNSTEEKVIQGNAEWKNSTEDSLSKPNANVEIPNAAKSGAPVDAIGANQTKKGKDPGARNGETKAPAQNNRSFRECDIFNGRWVRDESKPYYPPGSCPYIDRDFDCHLNGRPDARYEKWRWQPYGCDMPSLNVTDFLERLRGQKLVFVGDSLNRNMWESLVCILRHGVKDKKRVYEISGRREFKKKGFYAFRFEDYNCTVDFVSSPFLVRESSFNGKNGTFETLRLDLMDKTTCMYHDADVIIFNTGHWWTHEKTSRGEDYYQEGNHVHPRLKVLDAYKRALITWAKWVDKYIDGRKTQVIFRGYSVTHFRGGPWNSGGQCDKETEPIFNNAHLAKYPSKMRVFQNVLQGMKTPLIYLNISKLTDYRKDGHPSVYRPDYNTMQQQTTPVHAQDCSHWCLPGVPDTWNELLYVSLLKSGKGAWRN